MSVQNLHQHWALVACAAILFGVAFFLLVRRLRASARARLSAAVVELRRKEKRARKARRQATRASRRLDKLKSRGESAVPRRIEESTGRLEDARALLKIADDQVLIARNQVRLVIVEDFPPKRHEDLRRRLLPEAAGRDTPFTMGE